MTETGDEVINVKGGINLITSSNQDSKIIPLSFEGEVASLHHIVKQLQHIEYPTY